MSRALGLMQMPGFLSAVVVSDRALKAADVELCLVASAGGGLTTLAFGGEIAAVHTALDAGQVSQHEHEITTAILANPSEEVDRLLESHGSAASAPEVWPDGGRALGIIEVLGLEGLTRGVDALAKAAGIEISGYKRVGGGLTAICVWGEIAAVRTAIDAAQHAADIASSTVLAHPHPGIARVMELYR